MCSCSGAAPSSSGGGQGGSSSQLGSYEGTSGGAGDLFQPLHRGDPGEHRSSAEEAHRSPDINTGSPLHVRTYPTLCVCSHLPHTRPGAALYCGIPLPALLWITLLLNGVPAMVESGSDGHISDGVRMLMQDYSLVPGEHTAQAFQGLTFGGNGSGIGIGLGMLQQQQQQAAHTQGFQPQVRHC